MVSYSKSLLGLYDEGLLKSRIKNVLLIDNIQEEKSLLWCQILSVSCSLLSLDLWLKKYFFIIVLWGVNTTGYFETKYSRVAIINGHEISCI